MNATFHTLKTEELTKSDLIKIPTIIKNKVLMAPGVWNGVKYTSDEIIKAFEKTNWKDKDATSLILDHADKPLRVSDWVGWVKNTRMEGSNLIGDLELYDEDTLIKLVKAKAKFGISPRVKGLEENGEFKNFIFENFSVVTNPAVKKAYINLSQISPNHIQLKGGKNMTEKELMKADEDEDIVEDEESEDLEEDEEELAKKDKNKKYPYPKKCAKKKKEYPYPEEEQMSEEEMLSFTTMSDWTDFVARMKKKYPDMPFKDIAKAFKTKSKEDAELEELGDDEIVGKIERLTSILKRRNKYPVDEEKDKEKKMSEQIKEMSVKIDELNRQLNEPASKTVELAQASASKNADAENYSSGTIQMAEFLKSNFLKE